MHGSTQALDLLQQQQQLIQLTGLKGKAKSNFALYLLYYYYIQ